MGVSDRMGFEALFSHLDDDYTVMYNITWNAATVNFNMFGFGWRAG